MADRLPQRPSLPESYRKATQRKVKLRGDEREQRLFLMRSPWRTLRAAYLAANSLCEICRAEKRITAATIVHHKVDRSQRPDLALDWDNLASCCWSCHSRITRRNQIAGKG